MTAHRLAHVDGAARECQRVVRSGHAEAFDNDGLRYRRSRLSQTRGDLTLETLSYVRSKSLAA